MVGRFASAILILTTSLLVSACSQVFSITSADKQKDVNNKTQVQQLDQHLVRAGGLIFDPAKKPYIPAALDNTAQFTEDRNIYIVQFYEYGSQAPHWREQLKEMGASIGDHYIPDNSILAMMNRDQALKIGKMQFVRAVVPYIVAYKIDGSLKLPTSELRSDIEKVPLMIETWAVSDKQAVISKIEELNGQILDGATVKTNRLAALLSKEELIRLAQSPLIVRIREATPKVNVSSDGTKQTIDYG